MNNGMLFNKFSAREHDLILLALIMHDGFKHGLTQERYVRFDHPIISAEFVRDHAEEVGLTSDDGKVLYDIISSHMGEFNTSKYSNVVLPLPIQKFVHMCDDISSKKYVDAEFDDNHNMIY